MTVAPSIQLLAPDQAGRFLTDFSRALRFWCQPPSRNTAEIGRAVVQNFYQNWRHLYRPQDCEIGRFELWSPSDRERAQCIGALRHVLDAAVTAHRLLPAPGDRPSDRFASCRELMARLEIVCRDTPVLVLAAHLLALNGQFDEALSRAYEAYRSDTASLMALYVIDKIEEAQNRQSAGLPAEFDLSSPANRPLIDKFCPAPFEEAYINTDGDTFLCCPSTLPVAVGNIYNQKSWDEIWNSAAAQEIRRSILEGRFDYCNKRSCPKIIGGRLPDRSSVVAHPDERSATWQAIIDNGSVTIEETAFADLGYDISCNLACPQCRVDFIVTNKDLLDRLDRTQIIEHLLQRLKSVRITSGGEALFSKHFRDLLRHIDRHSCPNLTELQLLTNGMLFTRREWQRIAHLSYLDVTVVFSVDAGSKETFERIRRGGRWEAFLDNLHFAGELRRRNEVKTLLLVFAVQADNFREMPAAVRLALETGVDVISFRRLENVGTYTEPQYRELNVVDPAHPAHQEFLTMMKDDIFTSSGVAVFENLLSTEPI
jgi:MoaA/NifB/PqqE/SkfB family radical SAM enzyme